MNNDSFYRPTGNIKDANRTYVPDMYRREAAEMLAEENGISTTDLASEQIVRLQDRPVIGVLYSISAGMNGELFPVYIGRNTIGSDLTCDICLRETSVSAQHGMLLARKQVDDTGDEYVSVFLCDNNSSYGTSINGERLNFDKVTCTDGDVINIGQNYVLTLSLFKSLDKLSVAYGFDKIPEPIKTVDNLNPSIKSLDDADIPTIGRQDDHSTNITQDIHEDASADFYKPTRPQGQDHYNNKTIIL